MARMESTHYVAVKQDTVIKTGNAFIARTAELEYELARLGYSGLAPEQLRMRDPKLAWMLENPFDSPERDTLYAQASDGAILPFASYLPYLPLERQPLESGLTRNEVVRRY